MGGAPTESLEDPNLPAAAAARYRSCLYCNCGLYVIAKCNNCNKYILGPRGQQEIYLQSTLDLWCMRCGYNTLLSKSQWRRYYCCRTHREVYIDKGKPRPHQILRHLLRRI